VAGGSDDFVLEGTTRRVFRYIYRNGEPQGIHDIQRGLDLSSPSVAHYHVAKLLDAGLIKPEGDGYVADKTVFENMIKVRKTAIPLQTAFAVFLLTSAIVLLTVMRPSSTYASYVFALLVIVTALCVTTFEAFRAARAI
jgi:hypothetical protein